MIEDIEELCLQPHGKFFVKWDAFGQIHVGPEELWTAELVPAGVAKLAVGRTVSPRQAPVLGFTVEAKASGFSHCTVPGCVTPGMLQ